MSEELVSVWIDGEALRVRLNRGSKKNALLLSMYEAMTAALERAAADATVRAVVIDGAGDVFCAGNDLMDFVQNPPTSEDSPVFRFLMALESFPKPLLVGVHGAAVGIGTTMLLHADFAVAVRGTTFHMPFTQLGLVPEAASSLLVPRMVGHLRAAQWLMASEPFSADDAQDAGIVTTVVDDRDAAEAWLRDRVARLASLPPAAVRASKALMKSGTRAAVADSMRAEAKVFAQRLVSEELAEAVQAFLGKRKPDFSRFA